MLTFWSLVLLWNFGQNPQKDKAGEPALVPPAAKSDLQPPAKTDPKAPDAKAKDAKAPALPTEPDSELDKFIRAEAAKLDKITSVSAEVVYTQRNQDQYLSQKGIYKLGPNNRLRMEFSFGDGKESGKRLYVCDGANAYTVEEFGEMKRVSLFKIDRIRPLLEDKNITDEIRNNLWNGLVPFQKPGQMLRSYLEVMTFTDRRDDKLGDRDVTKLEGHWRKNAVAMFAGGDPKKTIDDLTPSMPRYMTLVLDKQTGWPLQMEMFQRLANVGVSKSFISLKFAKLAIGQTVPESDFRYTPPSNLRVDDATPMMESMLKRVIDTESAKKAGGSPKTEKSAAPTGDKKQP